MYQCDKKYYGTFTETLKLCTILSITQKTPNYV